MEYNTLPIQRELSADSGLPLHSHSRNATEEDTYVKKTYLPARPPVSPPPTPDSPFSYSPESSFTALGMPYNGVKLDTNTPPYVSGQNVTPQKPEPSYVQLQPKPDNPGNQGQGDIGGILKQLVEENKDSGSVINIGNITIHNYAPDPQYYGTPFRLPPDPNPCMPRPQYDYPEQPRDYQEDDYMGLPVGRRTPVEHAQSSVPDDVHINPYRETQNFLGSSRSSSRRTRDIQVSTHSDLRNPEPGPEDTTAQITIRPRNSSDGDSNQRWTGELKPASTSDSNPAPSPTDISDSEDNPYDSHIKTRDRNRFTVSQVSEVFETVPPTKRLSNTETITCQRTSNDTDDKRTSFDDDNTFIKLPSPTAEDEAPRATGQRVISVENPIYMDEPPNYMPTEYVHNQPGYSGGMETSRGGQIWTTRGWSMSQSTPDMRNVTLVPAQTPRRPSHFLNVRKSRSHQCVVQGLFSMHDEKAIEIAKKALEKDGKDGNWLVTSAVRQPMQSHCLHVRLQNKTNSFPINNLKGKKINIDTANSKTFKCLCEMISHYTKKSLPNQGVKLAQAFSMPLPCGGNTPIENTYL